MSAVKVTPEDIENAIQSVYWSTADKLVVHAGSVEHRGKGVDMVQAAQAMTVCMMIMKNGFILIGKSSPVDPANYDKVIGQKLAYEDCIRQAWPLMGFALKDKLYVG